MRHLLAKEFDIRERLFHRKSCLLRTAEFSNSPSLKLTAKAPENGWLEDDHFLLGPGLFSGALC